jgi:hypothetical protein
MLPQKFSAATTGSVRLEVAGAASAPVPQPDAASAAAAAVITASRWNREGRVQGEDTMRMGFSLIFIDANG